MITLELNLNSADEKRILKAMGKTKGLKDKTDPENEVDRDATLDELKDAVIQFLMQNTFQQERVEKVKAVKVDDLVIT